MVRCRDCQNWRGGNICGTGIVLHRFDPIEGLVPTYTSFCRPKNAEGTCRDFLQDTPPRRKADPELALKVGFVLFAWFFAGYVLSYVTNSWPLK